MLSDQFLYTTEDLKSGGDGLKGYGWHVANTVNSSSIDIGQSNLAKLTVKCNGNSSGLGASSETGPYIYKLITGDFDIQVGAIGNLAHTFEQFGLLVLNDSSPNLHLYVINYYSGSGTPPTVIAARNSNGSTESVIGADVNSTAFGFRAVRSSNTFTLYAQETSGGTWVNWGSVTRADMGSTVRVALYAGTNNNSGTLIAQFSNFLVNGELIVTRDDFENIPTTGNTDGSFVTDAAGGMTLSPTERSSSSLTLPRLMAVRLPSGSSTTITVTPTGTNASLVRLALDASGIPGTWGAYGAALTLSGVGTTNTLFWVQTQGAAGDSFGVDDSTFLAFTGFTGQVGPAYVRRSVVPTLSVLGTGTNLYLGYDWGGGTTWRHLSSGPGDMTVNTADGFSNTAVVYPTSSITGNVTTLGPVTLTSGLTLTTVVTKIAEGLNLVSHTLTSSIERWALIGRNVLDGAGGASVTKSADINTYPGNNTATDTSGLPLVAASAVHSSGVHVGIIAGNGYDNDWCTFAFDYVSQTSWYNKSVVGRGSNFAQLIYGQLANGSSTDYTIHLPAGTPVTVSYALSAFAPTSSYEYNKTLYGTYHDTFYQGISVHNHVQKMLWATAHQCQRLKRHIRIEGSKQLVIIPSPFYSPLISVGDISFAALGIGQQSTILNTLATLHALGIPDGAAANSNVAGSAGNSMDGSLGIWLPWLELFAQTFLGYNPDSTAHAQYLAAANAYADAINNVKMIPDTSTQLAHFYSDLFSGPENIGFGDFEQPFTFAQNGVNRNRWTVTSGTCTRVGITGGVTPRSGSNMVQVQQGLSAPGVLSMMPIAVPASKTVTLTGWVNIPTPVGTGAKISLLEYSADGSTLEATTNSSLVTSTSGWQQITLTVTCGVSTGQLVVQLSCAGASGATAYFDDIQCTMVSPDYPGILWNVDIMPPQTQGTMLTPSAFCATWTQLNLLCLKNLLGNAWTTGHQTALNNVNSTFPTGFWTSGAHVAVKEDLYHYIRKTWISSWPLFGHFLWYTLTGQKIFSDADVTSLYNGHPAKSASLPWGNVFKVGWVANPDGSSISGANFTNTFISGTPTTAGYFANAGGWLWASDAFFHNSGIWSSVTGAETNYLNRLRAEVTVDYNSHETINSQTGAVDAGHAGYAANAIGLATLLTASISSFATGFFSACV